MKKDVYDYWLTMQKSYQDTEKVLEKVRDEVSKGMLTQEQANNFEAYFSSIDCNYQRVAYIMYLLNKPPKFIQFFIDKKAKKEQERALKEFNEKHATKEDVVKENEEALAGITRIAEGEEK